MIGALKWYTARTFSRSPSESLLSINNWVLFSSRGHAKVTEEAKATYMNKIFSQILLTPVIAINMHRISQTSGKHFESTTLPQYRVWLPRFSTGHIVFFTIRSEIWSSSELQFYWWEGFLRLPSFNVQNGDLQYVSTYWTAFVSPLVHFWPGIVFRHIWASARDIPHLYTNIVPRHMNCGYDNATPGEFWTRLLEDNTDVQV